MSTELEPSIPRHVTEADRQTRSETEPPCVLIAEDDPDMRAEVVEMLLRDGYSVIEIESGDDMLDYLGRCASFGGRFRMPDLVISDIRMPGYTGLEILGAIRQEWWSMPVILMTAFGDRATHDEARRLGAVATFDKPFDMDDLRTAILFACPVTPL